MSGPTVKGQLGVDLSIIVRNIEDAAKCLSVAHSVADKLCLTDVVVDSTIGEGTVNVPRSLNAAIAELFLMHGWVGRLLISFDLAACACPLDNSNPEPKKAQDNPA